MSSKKYFLGRKTEESIADTSISETDLNVSRTPGSTGPLLAVQLSPLSLADARQIDFNAHSKHGESFRALPLAREIESVCTMYTCILPVANPKQPEFCECGIPILDHKSTRDSGPWALDEIHVRKEPSFVYGTLRFSSFAATKPSVPFIRVGVNDDVKKIAAIVRRLTHRILPKTIGDPNLILSITGGAMSFQLDDDTLNAIRKGITHAAENTNAWIITGGANRGVMKLVGELMAQNVSDRRAALIGIATWGMFDMPKNATSPTYSDRIDLQYPTNPAVGLDQNHNLFLLVDSGVRRWGEEIEFRAKLEREFSKLRGSQTPMVTIVIQGGKGTLKTAHDSVKQGTPLVVIDETGMAADVLSYAWEFCHGTSGKARGYTIEELQSLITRHFPTENAADMLDLTLQCVEEKDKVVIFSIRDNKNGLDRAILNAIMKTTELDSTKMLRQAIIWDRLDIAGETLLDKRLMSNTSAINDNMMYALKHNKPEFVELFLEHGNVWKLRPTDSQSEFGWSTFLSAVTELYEDAMKNESGHLASLVIRHKAKLAHRGSYYNSITVSSIEAILSRLISRDFTFERNISEEDFSKMTFEEKNNHAFHVLLIWAVCLNKFRLARSFWLRGYQTMPNALLASCLLDRMAHNEALSTAHLADEREKMIKNSKKFEALAIGVLEECNHVDPRVTKSLLHEKYAFFGHRDCIQIAHMADNLLFLSNPATQAVITTDWYNYIHTSTPTFWFLLCLLFPPLIFTLEFHHHHLKTAGQQSIFSEVPEDDDAATTGRPLSKLYKIYAFYNCPMTRFLMDGISFIILVLLHSYMVLEKFQDTVQMYEIALAVWVSALTIDEIRQMIQLKFLTWLADEWNKLDGLTIVLYFSGFIIRCHTPANMYMQTVAKTIFAVTTVTLFARLTRYYAGSTTLGPKIIMVRRMLLDLFVFFCLLFLLMLGYGIAIQALLYPARPFDGYSVLNTIYRPYFHIFGNLYIEDMQYEAGCTGTFFTGCGFNAGWLVAVLLALYLLLSNLLLVNLLIAMFNQTYISVQEQSMMLWNKQNYELLTEFKVRPFLPGPLVVFPSLVRIFGWLLNRCQPLQDDRKTMSKAESDRLSRFQELHTDKYIYRMDSEKDQTMEVNVKKAVSQSTASMSLMKQLQDDNRSMRTAIERQAVQLSRLNKTSNGPQAYVEPMPFKLPPIVYPFPNAPHRIVVPQNKIDWKVDWPQYFTLAPDFTAGVVLKGPVWADPINIDSIFHDFNTSSGAVNRRSFLGDYKFEPDTNRPLNPMGRTGMRGRGLLGKWGPNHAADPIVTRWKRSESGAIFERDGRRVLEFICIRRKEGNEWAIPGGMVDNGETVSATLLKEFLEEAMDAPNIDAQDRHRVEEEIRGLFSRGAMVAEVYSQDPRNTDNAWVETTAMHFHDDSGSRLGKFKLQAGDDAVHVSWRMVHSGLQLFASHYSFVQAVAKSLHAYW